MTTAQRTRWVCERARVAGFDLCGIAPATTFDELARLPEWLARGYAGEMKYLDDPRRSDPRLVLDGARSLIVVALNYNSPHPYSIELPLAIGSEPPRGWISRYAWGDDYHEAVKEKLDTLLAGMRALFAEPFEARVYVDTGPILERIAAKYAGLGWLGKNTCIINDELGSWLFLGVIVTTLELEPTLAHGEPPSPDLCGDCTLCLDACPTQAFAAPHVLDARRCISYLTIELRESIPGQLRPQMGRVVIGCDICQDVCPWNRKASVTQLAQFQPRRRVNAAGKTGEGEPGEESSLFAPELEWLASLSQREFSDAFRGSAVKRAKWRGTVRNACVALGNSGADRKSPAYLRIVRLLERLASSSDSLISEHARWALVRLGAADAPRTEAAQTSN